MNEQYFKFLSEDGLELNAKKWLPENKPGAVLQIAHGMAEHVERYNEFANFLNSNDIAVYANDHRGHGKNSEPKKLGYFADKDGWKLVLSDTVKLTETIKKEHPDSPIFLLGHSMGSMLTRTYLIKHNDNFLSGVIISGTSGKNGFIVTAGKITAKLQGVFKPKWYRSKLLTGMSFKGYNDPFKPTKTPYDWLSRDEERNQNYMEDKFCGFVCSNSFFVDMLTMLGIVNNKKNIETSPKNIPMFFLSGTMDPVGDFGKEVTDVYNKYKNAGVKDIKLKLYDGGRHEMLNETNRNEVFKDVLEWLKQHI